ncbi:MAG TPA: hypothetical protein VK961_20825 [Chthoniobacter sp.]|nr:hypothetical protein [Chthoniobacter sp.]
MSALSVIRGGLIGIAAVVVPSAVLGAAAVYSLAGAEPFIGLLCVSLAFVGGLAWVCVRFGRFSPRVAIILTTLPFTVFALMTMRTIGTDNSGAFLLWGVLLAIAVAIAYGATRLAPSPTPGK